MKIEVFGSGCCNRSNLYDLVERAIINTGIDAELEKVSDTVEVVKRGIMRTPALVIDGKIACVGRMPKYEEVLSWLMGGKS